METTEKTFRYSYIFKNLGALSLIFLAIVVAIGLIGRDTVFLICIGAMVGGGVIFLTWYLTTSVSVSESNIATKTLLGTKSLKWAEVDRISSRGSSSRLHNHDGDITLSISPRLDGSADVFQEVYNKRADLFDINKYSPFSRSASISVVAFVFGLFLVVIGLAGYLRGISDLTRTLIFGLVMCV